MAHMAHMALMARMPHMAQGSGVTNSPHSGRRNLPTSVAAWRSATTSECAVASCVVVCRL